MARAKTGGRAAGTPNKATVAIRDMAQRHSPDCVRKLHQMAMHPKTTEMARLRAIELLLAYGHGKPTESHELSGPGGAPLSIPAPAISVNFGDSGEN